MGGHIVPLLHQPDWTVSPSLECMPGDRVGRWILNGDAQYDPDLDTRREVWVGGGLA